MRIAAVAGWRGAAQPARAARRCEAGILHAGTGRRAARLALFALIAFSVAMLGGRAFAQSPATTPQAATASVGLLRGQSSLPSGPPRVEVTTQDANLFEYGDNLRSLPSILRHQWTPPSDEAVPESFVSLPYVRTRDNRVARLTLKQVVYLALLNNPQVEQARLGPLAGTEGVRMVNGQFDVDFLANTGVINTVVPIQAIFDVFSGVALQTETYDWDFTLNKVLSTTNGRITLFFDNAHVNTNNLFVDVNPVYEPNLGITLFQPLLRNFGWNFSQIFVKFLESSQKESQWVYAQALTDTIQRVGNDYWNAVLARENLRVYQETLKFDRDLVRQDEAALRVGTIAPIDLEEARAAAATAEANVASARAGVEIAGSILTQDVMLNPDKTFLPRTVQPADLPTPNEPLNQEEERSIEDAIVYRPSLNAMREAVRNALLEVKYQTNQLLPDLDIVVQLGVNAMAGPPICLPPFGSAGKQQTNCTVAGGPGFALAPFAGAYGAALNNMFGLHYYEYSALLFFEMPLDLAYIQANVGQAKAYYEQLRVQYRQSVEQAIVEVQTALSDLGADLQAVKAARASVRYARRALQDEQARFRVGMATSHDLLQYENQLVAAEGNLLQTEVALENAKLALRHADGTLLRSLQIDFQVQSPRERPWYSRF